MDKIAMYKEEIYKKAMARAWKKNIAKINESDFKRLTDSGILDHKKELAGLHKGTNKIVNKFKGKITKLSPKEIGNVAVRSLKENKAAKKIVEGQGVNINNIRDRALIRGGIRDSARDSAGYMNISGGKERIVNKGNIHNPRGALKKIPELKENLPQKGSLSSRYSKAILDRHEADELRSYINSSKSKKKGIGYAGDRIPITAVEGGHNSPKVIARESANVAIAPKKTQKLLNKVREFTGEIQGYKDVHNFNYGKSGVYEKGIANEMERRIAGLGRDTYKELLKK